MASYEKMGSIGTDFDGVYTLKSEDAYPAVFWGVLSDLDVHVTYERLLEQLDEHWGSSMTSILENLLPERPDLWKRGKQILKESLMDLFPELITAVPGSAESTERLATQYNLALISAADRDVLLERIFPLVGLKEEYFQAGIFTADQMNTSKGEYPKPDPYALNELMKRTGATPSNTIMVGDSDTDVLSAFAAGVEPIVTLTGNLTEFEAQELGVKYIIEDFTCLETEVIPRTLGRTSIGKLGWGALPEDKSWKSAQEVSIFY